MIKKFNEMNENKEKLSSWELDSKISEIIEDNLEEIPYEGTQVNKSGLKGDIFELIYELCPEYRPESWGNKDPWAGIKI